MRKYNFAYYIYLPKKKTALLSSGDKSATQNDCRQNQQAHFGPLIRIPSEGKTRAREAGLPA